MEVVVVVHTDEEDVALHWSRGFKAMEENLCRDYSRDQASCRELEVSSWRSNLSGCDSVEMQIFIVVLVFLKIKACD